MSEREKRLCLRRRTAAWQAGTVGLLIAAVAVLCVIGWRIMGKFDGFLNVRAQEKTMPLDQEKELEKDSRV